jgi:hypothetical protein
LRTLWTEVVRAVRGTVGSGGSRRRAPYGGLRSGEPALACTATEETPAEGRRLLVAFDAGDEGGRMARYFRSLGWTVDVRDPSGPGSSVQPHDLAFSLTGLLHG